MSIRVAIVGIDGLSPYITRKYFTGLLDNSLVMRLESIIPPITAPAWVSLATGLSPGKTGIIDFLNPVDAERRRLRPVSSTVYKGLAIWDYASLVGYRVCIVDYPMLYPPYPINGVMISGFLSPRWTSYPEQTIQFLQGKLGPHWEHIYFAIDRKYNDVMLFLEDLLKSLEAKLKWSLYLLCKDNWDLFIDVVSHTDWLFHRCWHILDQNHRVAMKNAELRREALSIEIRSLIDYFFDILERYVSEVESQARDIIIVSDHGFGPLEYIVNTAKLLKIFELTKFSLLRTFTKMQMIISKLKWFLFPSFFKKTPFELNIGPYDIIDYDESILYTLPHDELIMALYVNPKCKLKRDYLVHYLRSRINVLDLWNVLTIIDLQRLYKGPKTQILPDALIVATNYAAYFEFRPYDNKLLANNCKRRYTGTHRLEGVFIAKGLDFRGVSCSRMFEQKIRLLDVMPTVLRLLGIPIPDYVDGVPRNDIVRGSILCVDPTCMTRLRLHYVKMKIRLYKICW